MGFIKKTYRLIATFALLNLLAVGGGIGYLVKTGRLDSDRARSIAEIIKLGSPAEASADDLGDASDGNDAGSPLPPSSEEKRAAEEIAWRNAERYRVQLEQRLKLINAERLEVSRRREEFEKIQKRAKEEEAERLKEMGRPGYIKELEIIESLAPKSALKQITSMNQADAAQILFQLPSRKVKKYSKQQRARKTSRR